MINRKRQFGASAVGGLLAVMLYIASMGPAHWLKLRLYTDGHDPQTLEETYNLTYRPVYMLFSKSDAAMNAITWYVELWVPGDLENMPHS